MVNFERFVLSNGLRLLFHPDPTTPMATVCVTYNTGTKNEDPDKTGFAHLFEHLMFSGSKNAPNFDDIIQNAGGENNAFTNQDMTVYYDIVPLDNLETAIWIEADRMQNLKLTQKSLNRERKVVVEEFKETCVDEPYGDIWHHIGPLLYKDHPYSVPTIGKEISHIENAELADIESFYKNFYCPSNAILSVSANISANEVYKLVEKYFGEIPAGNPQLLPIPQERKQTDARSLTVESKVPTPAIFMIFHSAARKTEAYYQDEVLSDILGEGDASLIYKKLVKEKEIFSEADVYITGTIDPGLFILEGKLNEQISFEIAERALWEMLEELKSKALAEKELLRLQNRIEHNLEFAEVTAFHKAVNLGYYELLGNADWINEEGAKYMNISVEDLQNRALELFDPNKVSMIYYRSNDAKR
jgi:predicted Zn-dependent peptidase